MGEKISLISRSLRRKIEKEDKPNRNLSLHVLKNTRYTPGGQSPEPNIEALSKDFNKICFFDSNKNSNDNRYIYEDGLLAIGAVRELTVKNGTGAFQQLESFFNEKKSWLFGYLSYDLKNETEELISKNHDGLGFPLIHFFSPAVVIRMGSNQHIVHFDDEFISETEAERIYRLAFSPAKAEETAFSAPQVKNRISKEAYNESFNRIKKHIFRGDIYEVNFCQEFYCERAIVNPAAVFRKLNKSAEAPFSAFCRFDDHYILSSSPERFLKKEGDHLLSQPIKGTIRRSDDKSDDAVLKEKLRNDLKEQNENVMIVDLVRNDLSRIAEKGTVKVDELFGIYSFRQVHQMVSTVSCRIKQNTTLSEILKATFPMGSMTGAPKVRAMQLIEENEQTKRGVYSGALGYIDPEGNFDFSVVIRSILYNAQTNYLSFMTGSAITSGAQADNEYEECLLKARAMFESLR